MRECDESDAEAGFTFLELLVVLGIIALAAIFAMPLLNRPVGDATLTATAQKLANDMRVARAAAIRDNVERTLTIDLEKRRFWVDGLTRATTIPTGIAVDVVTLQAEQLSPGRGRLRFLSDGSATGGNVILRAGQRVLSIELNWMTGHASLTRGR
jgi:general secretion pathway protein H